MVSCCKMFASTAAIMEAASTHVMWTLSQLSTKSESTGWFKNSTRLVSVGSCSELSLSHYKTASVAYSHADLFRNPSRSIRAPGGAAYVQKMVQTRTPSPEHIRLNTNT
ncbi:hypothetical protein DPMN_032049 [Dreissena polymorpha]|uniref:Uncharacterized protein n=1 Tax=Dreissena polymorpha TaxID=45954 RepID=A0A9D4M384_DREPO|nr:hypothetical protein DPMN_032049 [Dreissena polymorpha]